MHPRVPAIGLPAALLQLQRLRVRHPDVPIQRNVFLDVGRMRFCQVASQILVALDEINAATHGRSARDLGDERIGEIIANRFFLPIAVKHPRAGVRNVQQLKKGGLFDLILHTLVGMVTGECLFANRIEQLRIKSRRIINFSCPPDHLLLRGGVIREVGSHPEGRHVSSAVKAPSESNDVTYRIHGATRSASGPRTERRSVPCRVRCGCRTSKFSGSGRIGKTARGFPR